MVDLENIHAVLFAKDIPYMGTDNMGASSVANMLANAYNHPFLPLNPLENLTTTPENDPGVKVVNPSTGSGLTLSGSALLWLPVWQAPFRATASFLFICRVK